MILHTAYGTAIAPADHNVPKGFEPTTDRWLSARAYAGADWSFNREETMRAVVAGEPHMTTDYATAGICADCGAVTSDTDETVYCDTCQEDWRESYARRMGF